VGISGRSILAACYKYALGRLLGWGLRVNRFAYPAGFSPVPTPARHYIDTFLAHYDSEVRGRCVEFVPPYYRARYERRPEVESYDVWDIAPSTEATVVADLQNAAQLPDGRFDCIVATHVLGNIERLRDAVREIHRLLSPGGRVLCTVPMVLQGYAPHPRDYWRFTPDSLRALFGEFFERVEVHSYGNAATASGSPQYLMTWHFSRRVLDRHDPSCPSIVGCAAWK
jgi:SAM-dependent methyltransferase